tara:strand:+ start:620 stop:1516 length:897 start_codon:yes stop_codon:yes gene_type:complete
MGLIIQNIEKSYGNKKVLSNLSFECKKGEIIGLLGLNGAGKTTLMKILTGSNLNWSGKVSFNGIDLNTRLKDVQKITGYLPENNPLYDDFLVIEYLIFISKLYNTKKSEIKKIIAIIGLDEYEKNKIRELSKGYKQRVGLAAALIHNPDLIILDEPTTGLDPSQIVEIRKIIKKLGQKKIVILSSHVLQEIETLCDRVILIHKGKIILDAQLNDLKKSKQQKIRVTFDQKIKSNSLEKLKYINNIMKISDFDYEILFDTTDDQRGKVFDFALDNDIKIISLYQKNESLEDTFRSLTEK